MMISNGYHELNSLWRGHLQSALEEDRVQWDWTTQGCASAKNNADHRIEARVLSKSPLVWVGSDAFKALKELSQISNSEFICHIEDGRRVPAQTVIGSWKSHPSELLAFERSFLNNVSFLSGIATRTRGFRDLADQKGFQDLEILATRKTLPGLKDLSLYAVLCGGGKVHRRDLASGILIKENHFAMSGQSMTETIHQCRSRVPHHFKIQAEVKNQSELLQVIEAGVDSVLLDNFTPTEVKSAINEIRSKTDLFIEVSGGIHEENFCDFLIPGVSAISIGGLTHTVRSSDLSLLFE